MSEHEWEPTPEPSGSLQPPRRRPPTAVGVLTPPPPPWRGRPGTYRSETNTRLVALGGLGLLFVMAGPALAVGFESIAMAVAGGTSVLIGGSLWWRMARVVRRRSRAVETSEPRREARAA